jgi:hypothetical protein
MEQLLLKVLVIIFWLSCSLYNEGSVKYNEWMGVHACLFCVKVILKFQVSCGLLGKLCEIR